MSSNKNEGTISKWAILTPPDKTRRYHFSNEEVLALENVIKTEIREDGNHQLETADGKRYLIRAVWLWMTVDKNTPKPTPSGNKI